MYDDPPKEDNFIDPYYRPKRTVSFKVDHPELSYLPQGHLLHKDRDEFLDRQRARMYTAWEPPKGGEARDGKKILA